jgi:hypothetical protein
MLLMPQVHHHHKAVIRRAPTVTQQHFINPARFISMPHEAPFPEQKLQPGWAGLSMAD